MTCGSVVWSCSGCTLRIWEQQEAPTVSAPGYRETRAARLSTSREAKPSVTLAVLLASRWSAAVSAHGQRGGATAPPSRRSAPRTARSHGPRRLRRGPGGGTAVSRHPGNLRFPETARRSQRGGEAPSGSRCEAGGGPTTRHRMPWRRSRHAPDDGERPRAFSFFLTFSVAPSHSRHPKETLNKTTPVRPNALARANSSIRLSARLITGRFAVQIRVGPLDLSSILCW